MYIRYHNSNPKVSFFFAAVIESSRRDVMSRLGHAFNFKLDMHSRCKPRCRPVPRGSQQRGEAQSQTKHQSINISWRPFCSQLPSAKALSPRAACTTPPRILRDYTCTLIRHQFLSPYHPIGRAVSGNSFTDLSSDDHVASAGLSRATKSNAAAPPDFAVVVTRAGRPPTSNQSPPSTSLRTLSVLCDI